MLQLKTKGWVSQPGAKMRQNLASRGKRKVFLTTNILCTYYPPHITIICFMLLFSQRHCLLNQAPSECLQPSNFWKMNTTNCPGCLQGHQKPGWRAPSPVLSKLPALRCTMALTALCCKGPLTPTTKHWTTRWQEQHLTYLCVLNTWCGPRYLICAS